MYIDQTLPPLATKPRNRLHLTGAREALQAWDEKIISPHKRADSEQSITETIANPALGPFISMITHDLRTPLAMAIGYAELLCANYPSPLSEEQANYARSILENTRRAVDLIGSLSEAFAAISGDLVLDRGWVDLSQLIREVTEELQAYLAQRKQNLQPINESGVRWILADKPRLAKALQLLLRFVARELPAVKVFRLHIAHTANEIDQLVLTLQATRHSSNGEEIFSRSLRQRRNRSLPILIATAFIEAHGGRLIWPDPGAQGVIARIHLPLDPG